MEFDGTDKRDKAETRKKGIRGPAAEGLIREGECNHHLFKVNGGHPEKEIHFVGEQSWGKSGVRVVSSVIIWGGALKGLVRPRM